MASCRPHFRRVAVAVSLVLLLSGCGSDSGQEPVTGRVTLDGAPLSTGTITFTPVSTGRSAGAKIQDGEFSIARDDGPESGSYKVQIVSRVGTGRQIPNPSNPSETAEEVRQIIPPRYNTRTELTAEVKAGGDNHFEFTLESNP